MIKTDVCILGAGPGGAAAALRLAKLGIPSVLVEKAKFPRDKICGDGMTGRTVAILNRIDPAIIETLSAAQPLRTHSWGVQFSLNDKHHFKVPFKQNFDKENDPAPCYVSRRMDFDNHLIDFVKKQPLIQFIEEQDMTQHQYTEGGGWTVSNKKGDFSVECKILIVANGPNSPFIRHQLKYKIDESHYAGAVRAYYKNVTGCHPDNFIELHFLKEYLPGYFWIFPLPNGDANVGVGMLTSYISDRKANLNKILQDIITTKEGIKERFANAQLEGKVVGFPLPLGSKRHKLSGDGFMLVGDAGSLVDPLTGEGIGNAVFSGYIAADQAEKCLQANNFSAEFMKDHDVRVWRVMGSELKISYLLQRLGRVPFAFNFVLWLASKNTHLTELVYSMLNDVNIRKKVINPIFWFKLIFNIK